VSEAPRTLLALYDEALPIVYGYFVRRCGDRGTAEDLTSETFLAAMDAARKTEPPPIAVPWLLGVARHKLADHYRRRHDRLAVPVAELPEAVDAGDDWDAELDRIVAESVLARLSATPHRVGPALHG
jgi:RNA polymerase sigma-70 factor (ECF subfamily)